MKLYEIIYNEDFIRKDGEIDPEITEITTDPKKIGAATLFVFLRSERFDIELIKEKVIAAAPRAIICDDAITLPKTDATVIRVESTRAILPYLYYRFYRIDAAKIKLCAVTGTNGKTSTATMIGEILKTAGHSVGFIGTGKILINGELSSNVNYSMTTPDPELLYKSIAMMINRGCTHIVMEVSSHALYFDKTAPLIFDVSVFTNLSSEHLDFHHNIEEYFDTKLKLYKQSRTGVFNLDDQYSRRAMESFKLRSVCVSTHGGADYNASHIAASSLSGTEYVMTEYNRRYKVRLGTGGIFNVYNSMMAIASAELLDVPWTSARDALKELNAIDGRLETIRDDVTVIIDYAHTPEAFKNVLKLLVSVKNDGQSLITVFGCGGDRDKMKRPEMARIAEAYSDKVTVTSDNSRNESTASIIADIMKGFERSGAVTVIEDRRDAIIHTVMNADDGDIIALLGKGHERYNIQNGEYEHFDEREIVKEALSQRRQRNK